MKRLLVLLVMLTFTSVAGAGQQYNAMEGRWETAPQGYEMKYNPMEGEWSYEHPRADLEYNPFENSWEYSPPAPEQCPRGNYFGPYPDWF